MAKDYHLARFDPIECEQRDDNDDQPRCSVSKEYRIGGILVPGDLRGIERKGREKTNFPQTRETSSCAERL